MEEQLKDFEAAARYLERGFGLAMLRYSQIETFIRRFESTSDALIKVLVHEAESSYLDIKTNSYYDKFFTDKAAFIALAEEHGYVETLVSSSFKQQKKSIHTAALIFAHSIVDEVANLACKVTACVDPMKWIDSIKRQNLTIEDSISDPVAAIKLKLAKRIKEYERNRSLIEKTQWILKLCGDKQKECQTDGFVIDLVRLGEIDGRRHDIIHGVDLIEPLPNGMGDIKFLQKCALVMIAMPALKYGLKIMDSKELFMHGLGVHLNDGSTAQS